MSRWAKALVAVLALVVVAIAAVLILSLADGGTVKEDPTVAARRAAVQERHQSHLEGEIAQLRREQRHERVFRREQHKQELPPASAGDNGTIHHPASHLAPADSSSFAQLEGEVTGAIGIAYAPLGSLEVQTLGGLQEGHAWSSFKVPVIVTLMQQQHRRLSSEQEAQAASAITASDNAAAAALFSDLEAIEGGLEGASQAIEGVLDQTGGPARVETAPPPPGAVSTWGQTEWSLSAAVDFYNALACDRLLEPGPTDQILGLMESVIPEQQWGLGEVSFPGETSKAFKAGWGPDGSESGPYLVRQSGIVKAGEQGAVITIAAEGAGGSFEAGVADLGRVAQWAAQNVPLGGACS